MKDWKEVREEVLANPEVKAEYDALNDEFDYAAMIERQLLIIKHLQNEYLNYLHNGSSSVDGCEKASKALLDAIEGMSLLTEK